MKPTEPILKLVNYTYAEMCNGEIRIHRDLQQYSPELFKHAVNHEIGHIGKSIWGDLLWDMQDLMHVRIHAKALKFYFKHPKIIFRMVSPLHFKNKQIEINYVLIFIYITYILLFWFMFSFV